jgi:hypothetical protein
MTVDQAGNYAASGGGTQYADGALRGTATGTVAMVDDGTNIQSMSGDATGKPNVNVSNTPTVKLSQTATDNDVDVVSSVLPTGAATSAAQTTGNSSLSSIDGKITACNTGAVAGTVTSTPLPSGKTDVDLKFSLSVATGAQTNQTVDSDAATNRAVKEIYVAANGLGEGGFVKFYRGATVVGEMYLIAKNFIIKDVLTYATSALTCDITTGNSGTITVYFNVKYYE